ncbi:MAG: recombination protein RecR [Candidatus Nephrothrix sp. EaCA]|nr:MAG: recombination protein RecR [Candidatus Nephrothrix sp. EaCA]
MEYPSKLIERAVGEIAKLPGIGKKTALRLVLHLVKENEQTSHALAEALVTMRTGIKFCRKCFNICDDEVCFICASHRRNQGLICVVEESKDVMAIENTGQYNGLYHVLGGVISPIQGIGPSQLQMESLIMRAEQAGEIILALSSTMEGDTTAFYIHKKLSHLPVRVSSIARGIPVGGELEYADEITLGRSITARTVYSIQEF